MSIPPSHNRCLNTYADGRQCRSVQDEGSVLCRYHRDREELENVAYRFGFEVLRPSDPLDTARGINTVLGRLFAAVVHGRMPPKHAAVAAYTGQLLLQSLRSMQAEHAAAADTAEDDKAKDYSALPRHPNPSIDAVLQNLNHILLLDPMELRAGEGPPCPSCGLRGPEIPEKPGHMQKPSTEAREAPEMAPSPVPK